MASEQAHIAYIQTDRLDGTQTGRLADWKERWQAVGQSFKQKSRQEGKTTVQQGGQDGEQEKKMMGIR